MGYKSRKNYRSRRDKLENSLRNTRIIIIFALIALLIWLFMHRREYWAWLETYFY